MKYEFISMMKALVFQFGGLLIWPIARIVDRELRRRNQILRGIFILHIAAFGLIITATVLVSIFEIDHYIPHSLYLWRTGMLSIIASVITLIATRRKEPPDYS